MSGGLHNRPEAFAHGRVAAGQCDNGGDIEVYE
jgi:hypothetical protein